MEWDRLITNICLVFAVGLLAIALVFSGAAIYKYSIEKPRTHQIFYTNCHPAERLVGKAVISGWDCTGKARRRHR